LLAICGIATDYHINESPLLAQDDHFKHAEENVTYITKEDWPRSKRRSSG
jgi:hypothetical protein